MTSQVAASRRNSAEPAILAQAFLKADLNAKNHPPVGAVQHFAADREIFSEGGNADYFYKVVSGVVRSCKFLSDGRRQIDAFHVAGEIFGFESGADYRLSAEAVGDCTIIAYRKNKQDLFAGNEALMSRELLSFAMHGMARAQDHSLLLGRRSAVEKVVAFLLDWAEKSADQKTVSLAMSRQDIADYLGLTIETVSRTLSQLERNAVIALPSARQIRLRNLDALQDLAC
jgi:CRP/FNR family transcriptional regulator, nitrogen fixation regulation protein